MMAYEETLCSVRKLLGSSDKYFIPIYQRNYSWGEKQVEQLIVDVWDYAQKSEKQNYYIGNLIVLPDSQDKSLFETIDGQQRLTTLYILICAIKSDNSFNYNLSWFNLNCLQFRNRRKSDNAVEYISGRSLLEDNCEENIISTWKTIANKVKSICKKDEEKNLFLDYLLDYVKVLRIPIPIKMDKNHYFEVMNSRGVQLEQHEIVKAELIGVFSEDKHAREVFSTIWNACSNMERFVQMNFSTSNRSQIFGSDWQEEPITDFDVLCQKLTPEDKIEGNKTLITLIQEFDEGSFKPAEDKSKQQSDEEQFYSVIDFPNFLLHVLKLLEPKDKDGHNINVTLDDKGLTSIFKTVLDNQADKIAFVKQFASSLLKCRFLFDKYTVRHMYSRDPDKWCMMRLRSRKQKNEKSLQVYYVNSFGQEDETIQDSDELIMLLSMFHVSVSAMIYKNWLYASLKYLFLSKEITYAGYLEYLRNLARSYMLDNYLAKQQSRCKLSEIADRYNGHGLVNPQNTLKDVEWSSINNGTGVEVFIFNYYDYLLWRTGEMKDFTFTHRTSVEHYYPQNPTNHPKLDDRHLHSFGNLCLISSSQNSRFSNLMPDAKRNQFETDEYVSKQSLKLLSMFDVDKNEGWWIPQIEKAESEAINLFKGQLE